MLRAPRGQKQSKSHTHAPRQEARVARRLSGQVTIGSGNKDIKGDVRIKGVARIECKCTQAKSFSITREMARKIEEAALGAGEVPAIQIDFLDGATVVHSLCVVPAYVLDGLVQ